MNEDTRLIGLEHEVGNTAVVTGASAGIGLVTAKALAARGWNVLGTGRNPERSAAALKEIRNSASSGATIEMHMADLSEMSDVVRVASDISTSTDRVDVLINNAGGTSSSLRMTKEGNEAIFAVNHLAPALLTNRLISRLRAASAAGRPARVINVSSNGHEYCAGLDFDDFQSVKANAPMASYCAAKLVNLIHCLTLAKTLRKDDIVVHAVHPGAVETNFYSYADEATQVHSLGMDLISSEAGADTLIWLATAPEPAKTTGGYYFERQAIPPSTAVHDAAVAKQVWERTSLILRHHLIEYSRSQIE